MLNSNSLFLIFTTVIIFHSKILNSTLINIKRSTNNGYTSELHCQEFGTIYSTGDTVNLLRDDDTLQPGDGCSYFIDIRSDDGCQPALSCSMDKPSSTYFTRAASSRMGINNVLQDEAKRSFTRERRLQNKLDHFHFLRQQLANNAYRQQSGLNTTSRTLYHERLRKRTDEWESVHDDIEGNDSHSSLSLSANKRVNPSNLSSKKILRQIQDCMLYVKQHLGPKVKSKYIPCLSDSNDEKVDESSSDISYLTGIGTYNSSTFDLMLQGVTGHFCEVTCKVPTIEVSKSRDFFTYEWSEKSDEDANSKLITSLTTTSSGSHYNNHNHKYKFNKNHCKCEMSTRKKRSSTNRIMGGTVVKPNTKPFQVGLRWEVKESRVFCGGSLISPRHVLTAAHCILPILKRNQLSMLRVVLGGHDMISKKDPHIQRRVSFAEIHPDYDEKTINHDIAILTLMGGDIDYSHNIQPICLVRQFDSGNVVSGIKASASGWGRTEEMEYSRYLLTVNVTLVNQKLCRIIYGGGWFQQTGSEFEKGKAKVTDNMLCAWERVDEKTIGDTCVGDSGGPLTIQRDGENFQIGIVSWGAGCASDLYPGVYARLDSEYDFINKAILNAVACSPWADI